MWATLGGAQVVKVSYQEGVDGYAGTVEAAISTQNAQFTAGNGLTSTVVGASGGDNLLVWRGPEYEVRTLVRFGNLGLPAGSTVQSASLQLTFENFESQTVLQGSYLAADWNVAAGGNSGLGWLHRDTSVNWASAGAAGSGTDVLANRSFTINHFSNLGTDVHKVNLDTSVAQGWVDNPTGNHGVLLVGTVDGINVCRMYTSAHSNLSYRPKLTISYYPPGTAPVPPPAPRLHGSRSADGLKFDLGWTSQAGTLYQMQWSTDLKTWNTLTPLFVAASSASSWTDDGAYTTAPPSGQARFYRLSTPDSSFSQPSGTPISFLPAMPGISYQWDFGDGTTSTQAAPTHTYAVDGNHTVSLTVTDAGGPHVVTCPVATEVPCRILLSQTVLDGLRAKAAAGNADWQDFQSRLDARLGRVIGGWGDGSYQGSQLEWLGDYALAYKVLEKLDPATASGYADKAIAILKSGLHNHQKFSNMGQQFLALGDGTTRTFTLPNADVDPTTLLVLTGQVTNVAITRDSNSTNDDAGYYQLFLKASNTPGGPADYQMGPDWRRNGDLAENLVDWSNAVHAPAPGSTYYLTEISPILDDLQAQNVSFNGTTITFDTAPAADQAILVQYIYGTTSADHSTLAWQQTSSGDGGFNSMLIDTGYPSRYLGKYLSIGYDWLYDYPGFTAALKAETAAMLVRWSDYWRDNGYHKDSPASNYSAGGYVSRMFTALALSAGRTTDGTRLVNEMTAYRQAHVVPLLTNPTDSYAGGFWAEGWNYGALACENLLLGGIAYERAGLGTVTEERNWSTDVIGHLVSSQPSRDTMYDGGDWYDYPAPFVGKELMYLLAAATPDATAATWANYIIQNYGGAQTQTMPDMVFRNPSASTAFWSAAPLQNYARGTGLVTARADWNYDSTWVAFQLGNLIDTDHQAYAQGQLEIQRGADPLLINVNALSGNQSIDTESSYGNLVAIDDNGHGHQNYTFNQGFWFGSPGCRITQYEAAAGYVYTGGDYHAAYSFNQTPGTGTATQLTRQVVYLRPDYVIVHDRAATVEADDPKQLRWHFLNAPTVDPATHSWTAAQGSSKLFGHTFSASALSTTSLSVKDPSNSITAWRVITAPASSQTGITWLTALQTAPSSTANMVSTAGVTSTDNRMEGVQMADKLVLFGTQGVLSPFTGTVSYTVTGTAQIAHLIADLEPGRSYQVMAGSTLVGTFTASTQGTITFSTTPSGSQVITVQ